MCMLILMCMCIHTFYIEGYPLSTRIFRILSTYTRRVIYFVCFCPKFNSFYLLTFEPRWNTIHGISSVGRGQSNPVDWDLPHRSRYSDEPLSVASLVIKQSFAFPPLRDAASVNSPNGLDWVSTVNRWLAVYFRRFLRLACYLSWGLSAQLTTVSWCRERFTLTAGVCSVPLRFGSLSPTFL